MRNDILKHIRHHKHFQPNTRLKFLVFIFSGKPEILKKA